MRTHHSSCAHITAIVPIVLFLGLLAACGGGKSNSTPISIGGGGGVPGPTPSDSPTAASAFGFQCGLEVGACGGGGGTIVWPTATAKPGFLRLHDAGTYWSQLEPSGAGQYDWTNLDNWLDTIAEHEPIDVSQVFIWVPCWDASSCVGPPVTQGNGTSTPPSDLTPSGSPSFNQFVKAFVTHCSPNNNCVASIIKYYELWNEWDLPVHWTGTHLQLYQMLAPAVAIIRQNVPEAVIMSPSTTPASPTYISDLQEWLGFENQYGKLSDWVTWHLYLASGDNPAITDTPETQWAIALNLINTQHGVSGWQNVPWANTETNFHGQTSATPYQCPPAEFTAADCTGQIVRWQLLHSSAGASSVVWYKWNITIGSNQQYDTAYASMMQYIEGGKFTAVCSGDSNNVWTCPFTESSGTSALFVWVVTNPSGGPAGTFSYTVPAGYVDYKDIEGNTHTISSGQTIVLGPQPFMLEQ